MNGKIENDPSVLIRVKSARTFRVHFNFIALNFFFCDSKSNEREGLETRDFLAFDEKIFHHKTLWWSSCHTS